MNDCTIVINTCDAYEDVWELFFKALEEHWPDCKYPIVMNTEKKKCSYPNVITHNIKTSIDKDHWGMRLKQTLSSISSKYVIMLYDDFILEAPVNKKRITNCINWLDNNPEIAVFYFNNNPDCNIIDKRFDGFKQISARADYKLNSAPAIWRKDKLFNYTENNDTPWAWEYFGSFRTYGVSDLFYCTDKNKEDIYLYNYSMGGAIYRGKWVENVVTPLIKKYNLKININIRGIADISSPKIKRSLAWKVNFFFLGFKMIKFGVFIFLFRIFNKKLGFMRNG